MQRKVILPRFCWQSINHTRPWGIALFFFSSFTSDTENYRSDAGVHSPRIPIAQMLSLLLLSLCGAMKADFTWLVLAKHLRCSTISYCGCFRSLIAVIIEIYRSVVRAHSPHSTSEMLSPSFFSLSLYATKAIILCYLTISAKIIKTEKQTYLQKGNIKLLVWWSGRFYYGSPKDLKKEIIHL